MNSYSHNNLPRLVGIFLLSIPRIYRVTLYATLYHTRSEHRGVSRNGKDYCHHLEGDTNMGNPSREYEYQFYTDASFSLCNCLFSYRDQPMARNALSDSSHTRTRSLNISEYSCDRDAKKSNRAR